MTSELQRMAYETWIQDVAKSTYDKIGAYIRSSCYVTDSHLGEVTGCYLEHRGKAVRPVLLANVVEAVGGDVERAIPACAAVEMFHTWTLMHDDVIDHDDFRRGRPAAHRRGYALGHAELGLDGGMALEYGIDLAILGGDLLHAMAMDMLASLDRGGEVTLDLVHRMAGKLAPELLSGEQIDVRLSQTDWERVTEAEIMEMMRLKTGALLVYCAEAGAAIGEGCKVKQTRYGAALARFAQGCGMAFQMKDDLLGVFGEAKTFGKPIGSDIREGKRTVLMLRTLAKSGETERRRLMSVLGVSDASLEDIDDVRTIISDTGADREVLALSEEYVDGALASVSSCLGDSSAFWKLEAWAEGMCKRNL